MTGGHLWACRDEDGKVECVCGLDDIPVRDYGPDVFDPDDRDRDRHNGHFGGGESWGEHA